MICPQTYCQNALPFSKCCLHSTWTPTAIQNITSPCYWHLVTIPSLPQAHCSATDPYMHYDISAESFKVPSKSLQGLRIPQPTPRRAGACHRGTELKTSQALCKTSLSNMVCQKCHCSCLLITEGITSWLTRNAGDGQQHSMRSSYNTAQCWGCEAADLRFNDICRKQGCTTSTACKPKPAGRNPNRYECYTIINEIS